MLGKIWPLNRITPHQKYYKIRSFTVCYTLHTESGHVLAYVYSRHKVVENVVTKNEHPEEFLELLFNDAIKTKAKEMLDDAQGEHYGQTRNSLFKFGPHVTQIMFDVVDVQMHRLSKKATKLLLDDENTVEV